MLDGACRVRSCLKGSSVCWLTGGEGRVSNDTVSQSSPDIYGLQKYLSDEQNRCYIIQVSQLRRLFSIFYHFLFFFAHFITPSLSQPFLQHQYLFLSFCLSSHRIHILDRGYSVSEGNVRYLLQFKTRQSQGERKEIVRKDREKRTLAKKMIVQIMMGLFERKRKRWMISRDKRWVNWEKRSRGTADFV